MSEFEKDSKPVRWGILSTAHIGTKVSKAMHRAQGAEPLAVASRDLARAQTWAQAHNVPRAYGSYVALLEDPDIDAVYISLPPSLHHEWTIKAAEHGKHVLCEKPLARNAREAVEMSDACRQYTVQLMDGVMWVHHARTRAMREVLDRRELGDVRRMTAAFCFIWDEIPKDNIRLNPALAGGSLGDLGYYCCRAIWWAMQEVPVRAFATARFFQNVDFNLSGLLWFDDPCVASFDCGFDLAMRQWFEVAGTQGSLVCDDFVLPWSEEKARFWRHDGHGANTATLIENCVQEVQMIENFSEVVRTGHLEPQWTRDAIVTQRMTDALAESARTGQPVEL